MSGKKLFAALVFLTILSTIIGAIDFNQEQAKTAVAAPMEMNVQTAPVSCLQPGSWAERDTCAKMEDQILSATIRIELHTWASFGGYTKDITTKSHATILDGRYLVTHNHYKYSLTEQVEPYSEVKGYTAVSLRAASGELILDSAALNSFRIVYEDPATLVFEFVDENSRGLFEAAGLPSAEFAGPDSISLKAGVELAQIDWDGEDAHVDWVTVDNLSLSVDIPQFQVNNFPKKGCSGGGVFLNGVHIGNNWGKNIEKDPATDEITRRYSVIALNSNAVAAFSK